MRISGEGLETGNINPSRSGKGVASAAGFRYHYPVDIDNANHEWHLPPGDCRSRFEIPVFCLAVQSKADCGFSFYMARNIRLRSFAAILYFQINFLTLNS